MILKALPRCIKLDLTTSTSGGPVLEQDTLNRYLHVSYLRLYLSKVYSIYWVRYAAWFRGSAAGTDDCTIWWLFAVERDLLNDVKSLLIVRMWTDGTRWSSMQLDPGLLARARRPGKEAMWVGKTGKCQRMKWDGGAMGVARRRCLAEPLDVSLGKWLFSRLCRLFAG